MYFIYALIDPRTNIAGYIGITKDVQRRLKQHIKRKDSNMRKRAWIQTLQSEQAVPCMKVLETVDNELQARMREEYWIQYYLEQGVNLTNIKLCPSIPPDTHEIQVKESLGRSIFRGTFSPNAQGIYELSQRVTKRSEGYGIISNQMKGFYTAKQAREILGVTDDKFQYMVRTEQVRKVVPPGRTYGVYPQAEIDELAAALTGFTQQYNQDKKREIFRVARPEDAGEMYKLGQRIMERNGGFGIPPEKLLPFLSIPNSEIGHVLIRENQLVGYFTIIPLSHDKLLQRMRGETTISQMKPTELASFEPGKPIDCFIWEVMSDPDKKHIAAYLIGKLLTFFHTLGKRGVDIEGIYATASSPEGINLCRRIGMHLMDLPNIQPNFMPFELKPQEQRNWLTKNYIQALRSYKIRQKRLSKPLV